MKKLLLIIFAALIFLLSDNLFAQIKLITSIPGVLVNRLNYEAEVIDYKQGGENLMDFSGDGIPELTLMEEEGAFYYLKIIDGIGPTNKWEFILPTGEFYFLIGFFNLREGTYKPGEGITFNFKEIILAQKKGNKYINPVIISSDDNYETVEYESFGENVVFVATGDINNDGTPDLVIYDPDAKEVQIWGYE